MSSTKKEVNPERLDTFVDLLNADFPLKVTNVEEVDDGIRFTVEKGEKHE